jgi:hypothetical protein
MDTPEFVDVPSIVNGYEHARSTSAGLSAEIFPNDSLSTFLGPDVGGTRTMIDRPTITYAPQTGSEFIRNLTHPIPPMSIFNLIESGYPADVVMELAVESIKGIRNRRYAGTLEEADPEFNQVVQIMKKAQASGHVSLRVQPGTENGTDVLLSIRDQNVPSSLAEDLDQMRRMLNLDPDTREFKIVFGMLPQAKDEIAFRTRSVLRVMIFLTLNVQVPECHLIDGRAPDLGATGSPTEPEFTVFSSCEMPEDVFTAVRYQGYWFWIDQRDYRSKKHRRKPVTRRPFSLKPFAGKWLKTARVELRLRKSNDREAIRFSADARHEQAHLRSSDGLRPVARPPGRHRVGCFAAAVSVHDRKPAWRSAGRSLAMPPGCFPCAHASRTAERSRGPECFGFVLRVSVRGGHAVRCEPHRWWSD